MGQMINLSEWYSFYLCSTIHLSGRVVFDYVTDQEFCLWALTQCFGKALWEISSFYG